MLWDLPEVAKDILIHNENWLLGLSLVDRIICDEETTCELLVLLVEVVTDELL